MTFNWSMRGYEVVKTKIEWNVQVPFLNQTTSRNDGEGFCSPFFATREVPNSQWQLMLHDDITKLRLEAYHHHLTGQYQPLANSVLVMISILNKKRHRVQQQLIISQPNMFRVEFFQGRNKKIRMSARGRQFDFLLDHSIQCENRRTW